VALEPWRSCSLLRSALVQVVVLTEISATKSKLLCDWQSVSEYVLVSSTLVGLATRYYSCRNVVWNLRSCIYWAPCLTYIPLLMSWSGPNIEPRFSVARCLLSRIIATTERYYCAYALLWECCCIATNTCRLVLLRIGYRCSQRVGGFHGRLPHVHCSIHTRTIETRPCLPHKPPSSLTHSQFKNRFLPHPTDEW
jgi:hypothetical protein